MTIKHPGLSGPVIALTKPGRLSGANGRGTLAGLRDWLRDRRAIGRIYRREVRSLFFSPVVYGGLTLGLLTTGLIVQNYLFFVQTEGLFMTSAGLNGLFYAMAVLASLGLGTAAVTSIGPEPSRHRTDDRADAVSLVLGIYLGRVTTCLGLGLCYGGGLVLLAAPANFSLSPALFGIGLLSVLITGQVVALALFFTALFKRGQVARIWVVGIGLALIVSQIGPEMLAAVAHQEVYDPFFVTGQVLLSRLRGVLAWLSPYAHLSRGIEAVVLGTWSVYVTTLLSSALQTGIFLGLGIIKLQRNQTASARRHQA